MGISKFQDSLIEADEAWMVSKSTFLRNFRWKCRKRKMNEKLNVYIVYQLGMRCHKTELSQSHDSNRLQRMDLLKL